MKYDTTSDALREGLPAVYDSISSRDINRGRFDFINPSELSHCTSKSIIRGVIKGDNIMGEIES